MRFRSTRLEYHIVYKLDKLVMHLTPSLPEQNLVNYLILQMNRFQHEK